MSDYFDLTQNNILSILTNFNASKAHSINASKSLFNYFMQNKLFTECQSGFIPGESCNAQLLSNTHEIHKSFG